MTTEMKQPQCETHTDGNQNTSVTPVTATISDISITSICESRMPDLTERAWQLYERISGYSRHHQEYVHSIDYNRFILNFIDINSVMETLIADLYVNTKLMCHENHEEYIIKFIDGFANPEHYREGIKGIMPYFLSQFRMICQNLKYEFIIVLEHLWQAVCAEMLTLEAVEYYWTN